MRVTLSISCALLAAAISPLLSAQTYTNPIFGGADPWIVREDGTFYYSEGCEKASVCIKSAPTLEALRTTPAKPVWTAPPTGSNSTDVWAPEIHKVNGRWYIYYAADSNHDNNLHRIYVIEATTADPLGPYQMGNTGLPNGQIAESFHTWGIDPNVFTAADGRLYIVWSCWHLEDPRHPQTTCLARMSDPLHIEGNASRISEPREPWEIRTAPVQEGPVGYVRNGRTYITYSGSASWEVGYSVGVLVHTGGDMLIPSSWSKHGPVFDHHDTSYGPGSVVFVQDREGDWWNLFHGIQRLNCQPSYSCRNIRIQPMSWEANGMPLLGYPFDPAVSIPDHPSGDKGVAKPWGPAFGDRAEGNGTAGLVVGEWANRAITSNEVLSLGPRWSQTFLQQNPNAESYTVSVDLQMGNTGTSSAAPRYGIYTAYSDVRNFASVWIDPQARTVSTYGVADGALRPWAACSLPPSFNAKRVHRLQVKKVADTFAISVNGTPVSGACVNRKFGLLNGQVGLVSEDARVRYNNISVQ